uniref:Reverse transcriptase domain-containing protein n=1 Tax=Nicotiana tabacum TaxID=4097 RepID=A0A1S4AY26_TOBAC|nr:PREDICTED: uncharacterized protein LOC107802576 [Nicotiana tabacum]
MSGGIKQPWLVTGDVNSVLYPVEDVDTHGMINTVIIEFFSKIDWAFVNREWMDNMSVVQAEFLVEEISDHCPLRIKKDTGGVKRNTTFKFCNVWVLHSQFKKVVTQGWQQQVAGCNYYETMLGRKEIRRGKAFQSLLKNGTTLNVIQQMELIQPFTVNEVKHAMFSIDVNKISGPDGYGSGFYREAWSIIGNYVTTTILEFMENGKLLRQVNSTVISLIPKVPVPEYASQFGPISCCNVIYKCISKRLKKAVSILAAENQAAFVEDDLMIFCKGNMKSIARVMEALQHFSDVTGLEANIDKSSMYLDLPLTSRKWNKMDYKQLVDKITNKITVYTSFWSTVFILPQSLVKLGDKKCRDFLWGAPEDKRKVNLVAWKRVCIPKQYGGLNIKSCCKLNIAAVGKLLWQLARKKDTL